MFLLRVNIDVFNKVILQQLGTRKRNDMTIRYMHLQTCSTKLTLVTEFRLQNIENVSISCSKLQITICAIQVLATKSLPNNKAPRVNLANRKTADSLLSLTEQPAVLLHALDPRGSLLACMSSR